MGDKPTKGPTLDVVADYLADYIKKTRGTKMDERDNPTAQKRADATQDQQENNTTTQEGPDNKKGPVQKDDDEEASEVEAQVEQETNGPVRPTQNQKDASQSLKVMEVGLMNSGFKETEQANMLINEVQLTGALGNKETEKELGYTVEFPDEIEDQITQKEKSLPRFIENLLVKGGSRNS